MHWLQALDTHIFYFINHSLSNPLFDWLMPVLSGGDGAMQWFVLAVFFGALAAIFFGNTKTRLCALMIILVVALGDPLVCNTIKHAIMRPRPCMALPNVTERLGCSHSGSMPSSHSANWFAATMVVFLFYRRKIWLMLPVFVMALAVSFSRVYNGVHYPGDVLAGAILGAGYAAALVIALQAIWNFVGKKWFPLWYERLPSLVQNPKPEIQNPPPDNAVQSKIENRKSEIQWLRLGYILIFAAFIGRCIYLTTGTIQLSEDEAYQWTWSKHLALSYFSKPPGIAFIQFFGTHIFGDTQLGVRFFSPVFAAILSFMLLRFFAREAGAKLSFWLLLAGMATPLLGVGSILMTIDPPTVLCWTWAMVAGWRALQPDGKTRHWLIVGLAMGLGFLCKYNAFFQIICFGIFFALWKPSRIHLRKSGPWLALLIFLLCTLPVFIWNAQNGWITVHHVAGNAGLHGRWHPTLRYFWDFIYQELALLNPILLIGAVWAAIVFWKTGRNRPLWIYFFCMGAPVFFGHWIYSFHSRILPNWIAVAVLPMFCLMALYWNEKFRNGARFVKPVFVAGLALGFFAVTILFQSNLIGKLTGEMLPGKFDPLRRVRGWSQTAALAENAREKLQQESGKPAFIICSHYGITGLFSFYIPQARKGANAHQPLVYYMHTDAPKNEFYFWPEYKYLHSRKGENAIFAMKAGTYKLEKDWPWKWLTHQKIERTPPAPESLPPEIADEFESVADLGEHDVEVRGRVYQRIHLWACHDLK